MNPMGGIGRLFFTVLVIIPIILLGIFTWNYNQLPVFRQQIDGVLQEYGGFSGNSYFYDTAHITHFNELHGNSAKGYNKYAGPEHARIYRIEAAHHFMFIASPPTNNGRTYYPGVKHHVGKDHHLGTTTLVSNRTRPYKNVPFGNKIYYNIYVSVPMAMFPLHYWGNQAQRIRLTRPEFTVSEKPSEFDDDKGPDVNPRYTKNPQTSSKNVLPGTAGSIMVAPESL